MISARSATGADAGVTNGAFESLDVAAPVGEKICAGIEGEDESFVFLVQNSVEKIGGGLLFGANHIGFAAAGIDEKPDGQGQSFFAREEGNFLFDVVFENAEIILSQVRDDGFLFVEDGGVKIYERNADADGLILSGWRRRCGLIHRKDERAGRE